MLGLTVDRAAADIPVDGLRVAGCVQVSGAWEGAVLLLCADDLAKAFAAAMFGSLEEDITDDEVRDALGELTNMVAGNIKAQLPAQTRLSMPTVARGRDFTMDVRGAAVKAAAGFLFSGRPFSVCVATKWEVPAE